MSSIGICLAWIELIFLFGRYPFLSGEILPGSSTFLSTQEKRIIQNSHLHDQDDEDFIRIFTSSPYPSYTQWLKRSKSSGKFSIMYYSITKRIVKAAFGFIILIVAFTFAFFIIHFNNETESFDDLFRSFLKVFTFVNVFMLKSRMTAFWCWSEWAQVFVMTLGEFEFDELWTNSHPEDGRSKHFSIIMISNYFSFTPPHHRQSIKIIVGSKSQFT